MRALALTISLLTLIGCPENKAPSGEAEPAHPLLVAKCQAGTKTACDELQAKCKEGDEAACEARKNITSERSIPMRAPEGADAPAPAGTAK